jgi:hypothetical protein
MPMRSSEAERRIPAAGHDKGCEDLPLSFGNVRIAVPRGPLSGRGLILLVEDLSARLGARTLQVNPFWRAMVKDPESTPASAFHGMCIENYHLLFRESYFDAPVLSFASSRRARELINAFYCEELGHDKLLLKALESIGIDAEVLYRTVPLAGTMALCNALSYWARHDPLFFFTTLGPLEGRDVEVDSFVTAARQRGLPDAFVDPIMAHANINKNSAHGLLTREIFEHLPAVSRATAIRVLRNTELFIRIYDRFYSDIWQHYVERGGSLRQVDEY